MTLFELTFTLSALILGLALTHMASSLYRLVLAGRRVRWALEPLMQATLVLLIVVFVWLNEWNGRGVTTIIYGRVLLRALNLLVLYIAAAVCLPEVREGAGEVNMYAYYSLQLDRRTGVSLALADVETSGLSRSLCCDDVCQVALAQRVVTRSDANLL